MSKRETIKTLEKLSNRLYQENERKPSVGLAKAQDIVDDLIAGLERKKYRILVDEGQQGFNRYGGITLAVWLKVRYGLFAKVTIFKNHSTTPVLGGESNE